LGQMTLLLPAPEDGSPLISDLALSLRSVKAGIHRNYLAGNLHRPSHHINNERTSTNEVVENFSVTENIQVSLCGDGAGS
jgi:hypothetical protein